MAGALHDACGQFVVRVPAKRRPDSQTQARRRSRYHHLVVVISSKQKGLESPGRLAAGKPTRIRARTNSRGWSRSRSPRHRSYSKLGRPSSYLVTLLPLNCRAKLVRDHQSPTCLNLTSFSVDTVTCTATARATGTEGQLFDEQLSEHSVQHFTSMRPSFQNGFEDMHSFRVLIN